MTTTLTQGTRAEYLGLYFARSVSAHVRYQIIQQVTGKIKSDSVRIIHGVPSVFYFKQRANIGRIREKKFNIRDRALATVSAHV